MPNTILHFAPNSYIYFLLQRYLDFPSLILVNVLINSESYFFIIFRKNSPIHGYLHTFLIGSLAAVMGAFFLYLLRGYLKKIMGFLRIPYAASVKKMVVSSLIGAWVHILLDAPVYSDMKPFFPFKANPLYTGMNELVANLICALFFIPAFILYRRIAESGRAQLRNSRRFPT